MRINILIVVIVVIALEAIILMAKRNMAERYVYRDTLDESTQLYDLMSQEQEVLRGNAWAEQAMANEQSLLDAIERNELLSSYVEEARMQSEDAMRDYVENPYILTQEDLEAAAAASEAAATVGEEGMSQEEALTQFIAAASEQGISQEEALAQLMAAAAEQGMSQEEALAQFMAAAAEQGISQEEALAQLMAAIGSGDV
jgi:hypothetical protein